MIQLGNFSEEEGVVLLRVKFNVLSNIKWKV